MEELERWPKSHIYDIIWVDADQSYYLVSRGASPTTTPEYWKAVERIGKNCSPTTLASFDAPAVDLKLIIEEQLDIINKAHREKYNC